MIAAELFRAGAIACYDGVQDSNMLTQNALRHLRIVAKYFAHDAAQSGRRSRDRPIWMQAALPSRAGHCMNRSKPT